MNSTGAMIQALGGAAAAAAAAAELVPNADGTYDVCLPDVRVHGDAWAIDGSEVCAGGGCHFCAEHKLGDRRAHVKVHGDGWTISGDLCDDCYQWVEEFEATHPELGSVATKRAEENAAQTATATSPEAWKHFVERHRVFVFDYGDI